MLKYTETDKWRDAWFTTLSPLEKLLFIFLYENCDEAGFIEVNYPVWVSQLGMDKKQIYNAFVPLKKALLSGKATGSNILWIRKYLEYQNKLPLDSSEHALIIKKIRSNISKFSDPEELNSILSSVIEVKVEKTKKRKDFIPPDYNEFSEYHISVYPDTTEEKSKDLYDYYTSCNWMVGKNKKMHDWKAAVRLYGKEKNKRQTNSRTQTTMSVVEGMKV